MGVDITHIIRHDFRNVENKKTSEQFVIKTIDRLKKNLLIQGVDDSFECESDESFRLPVYDVAFTLHNGFWQIESFYHYCQVVMHQGDYFWLRRMTFDIARALGQDEAWYAEEYYTWNGGVCDMPNATFEQWYEDSIRKYGKQIPEFDQQAIIERGDDIYNEYEPIYHDSFKECQELCDKLQARLGDYRLLGLYRTGNVYLRCEKDGLLYLINEDTLKPLFDEPIEGMLHSLNGPEFIIKKNGLSAVFDKDGKQLTDFVTGTFTWKYGSYEPLLNEAGPKKIIYNEEAGIKLILK